MKHQITVRMVSGAVYYSDFKEFSEEELENVHQIGFEFSNYKGFYLLREGKILYLNPKLIEAYYVEEVKE